MTPSFDKWLKDNGRVHGFVTETSAVFGEKRLSGRMEVRGGDFYMHVQKGEYDQNLIRESWFMEREARCTDVAAIVTYVFSDTDVKVYSSSWSDWGLVGDGGRAVLYNINDVPHRCLPFESMGNPDVIQRKLSKAKVKSLGVKHDFLRAKTALSDIEWEGQSSDQR